MQKSINTNTIEVENKILFTSKNIDKVKADKLKKYIGTQLLVSGLTSKSQVDLIKQGFIFLNENRVLNFKAFDKIYFNTTYFEVKNLAFIYLDKNHKHITVQEQINILPKWVKTIDNWAHSDYLSKFLTRLLEHNDTKTQMLNYILIWNTSKKIWERRQSLISIYYYAKTKKQYIEFDFAIQLINNLLLDKEYYVQKAVGWALRESFNVYPKQTYNYIQQNIKSITPIAFTTCIEKMDEIQKINLKQKRKQK